MTRVALQPSQRAADLDKIANDLSDAASKQWKDAGKDIDSAKGYSGEALAYALDSVMAAVGGGLTGLESVAGAVVGTVEAGAATAIGLAAIPVYAAEELQDGATGLVNGFAKMLARLANAIKDSVGRGGTRASIEVTPGDPDAERLSESLLNLSGKTFERAAESYAHSWDMALSTVNQAIFLGESVVLTAKNVLLAAGAVAAAAKDTGDAAVLKAAEGAVRLAAIAVDSAEQGTYAAAAALTAAAQGISAAASAVNSARGDDVKINVVPATQAAA